MKLFSWFKSEPKHNPIKEYTQEEFDKIKFKARIAFVDDEEIAHVERLRNDGYNIQTMADIENVDDFLRRKYHAVVLDIQGVGQHISPESEGWGILRYLKKECPNLVVIMYTGAEWSITKYKEDADLADDFIGKDMEFLDFKYQLDIGIKKAFSPEYHFEIEKKKISKQVGDAKTVNQIKSILENYGNDRKKAKKLIRKITDNKIVLDSVDTFLNIINQIKEVVT
jgi:DNA-binding NtrC family response regulator